MRISDWSSDVCSSDLWAEREGKEHDRKIIDLMLAHVPTGKVEGAYNRAAYMPRRRELATIWSDMLSDGLSDPTILIERPSKVIGEHSRRRVPDPLDTDFRFPGGGQPPAQYQSRWPTPPGGFRSTR